MRWLRLPARELAGQRRLKAAVVVEQLRRLAGIEWSGEVEAVETPETTDGLGWRTRMRYHADAEGRPGLRRHRSGDVVPLPAEGCPIAHRRTAAVSHELFPPGAEIVTAAATTGTALLVDGELRSGEQTLVESVAGRELAVAVDGFWQVHPAGPPTLLQAVLHGLSPEAGERAFDLYCGAGLFAAGLADRGCRVWGVDGAADAVELARRTLADCGSRVRFTAGRVERALPRLPRRTDLVVLDPPRSGAGRSVMAAVAARRPRAVAYVACDPAALARDLTFGAADGYRPVSIRAFDLFPMTAHVECVAILEPGNPGRVYGPGAG